MWTWPTGFPLLWKRPRFAGYALPCAAAREIWQGGGLGGQGDAQSVLPLLRRRPWKYTGVYLAGYGGAWGGAGGVGTRAGPVVEAGPREIDRRQLDLGLFAGRAGKDDEVDRRRPCR